MSSGPRSINNRGREREHKWGTLRDSQTAPSFHRSNVDQRIKEDQNDSKIPGWSCWKRGRFIRPHGVGKWGAAGISGPLERSSDLGGFKAAPASVLPHMSFHQQARQRWQILPAKPDPHHLPHPHVLKTNYKITGWAELVAAICLDLRHPSNAVSCEAWHEKLIEIDLERSAIKWIENWLKDNKQRMMTHGTAVRSRVQFPTENSVQCLHESGSEFISGQWGVIYKEVKRI